MPSELQNRETNGVLCPQNRIICNEMKQPSSNKSVGILERKGFNWKYLLSNRIAVEDPFHLNIEEYFF